MVRRKRTEKMVAKKQKVTELREIEPITAGKMLGLLYLVYGFVGGIFTFVSGLTTTLLIPMGNYAVMNLVVLPVFYGVVGFVIGLIGSAFYNLFAHYFGGVKIKV
jgi:hypothetical protein